MMEISLSLTKKSEF